LDILVLQWKGLSQRHIARKLGISRNTVKRYVKNQGYPERAHSEVHRRSLLDPFQGNIVTWLEEDIGYKATWIYDHLLLMGFAGSYEIVKRAVHGIKDERQRIAFMRFETEPGYQSQVDLGEFQFERADGTIGNIDLFSMILGFLRRLYSEFVDRCDLPTFLDCHIRAFAYFGGVTEEILYDRMKNVFIRRLAGKDKFNDTLTGFALHYGFKPRVAPPYAAWVKGKVERPYHFIREGFWRGYGFIGRETTNRDLLQWLQTKDQRIHGTTHEVVSERFERERSRLQALPLRAFNTSWRVYRKVNKDCTVRFEGNSYVVPHTLVGKDLVLRVKDGSMRIFAEDYLIVVTYGIPEGKGPLVQDKRFYKALKRDREINRRKYGQVRYGKGRAKCTISPLNPLYDMDVEIRSPHVYDFLIGEVRI